MYKKYKPFLFPCDICREEVPYKNLEICQRCNKHTCFTCTKFIEPSKPWTPNEAKLYMKRKLFDNPACPQCHDEIEKENNDKNAQEEEKREEEEHRKEDEEQNPKFKCSLCTASGNFQSTYSIGAPLVFSSCPKCGRSVCTNCMVSTEMYESSVCKSCYDQLLNEKANKWDREYKDICDWPNPYRSEKE